MQLLEGIGGIFLGRFKVLQIAANAPKRFVQRNNTTCNSVGNSFTNRFEIRRAADLLMHFRIVHE